MDKELKDLINLFSKSNLTILKYKDEEISLELGKGSTEVKENKLNIPDESIPVKSIEEKRDSNIESQSYYKLESPLVGIFFSSPSPDSPSFVEVDKEVKKGDVLCIVEAMKMFNEVKSPMDGIVKKINFKDEDLVQFGDIIFEIEEK